jgi:hypothetical protein
MRIMAICFLLFPLLLTAQTGGETDEHAIHAVMDRFMDAWNHHDAKAFAAVFAEGADFTNIRGIGASGRQKIEDFHAPVLPPSSVRVTRNMPASRHGSFVLTLRPSMFIGK